MNNLFEEFYKKYIENNENKTILSMEDENYQFCIVKIAKDFYCDSIISEIIDKFSALYTIDFCSGGYLGFYSKKTNEKQFFNNILDKRIKILVFSEKTHCVNQGTQTYMHYGPLYCLDDTLLKQFFNLNYGEMIYSK